MRASAPAADRPAPFDWTSNYLARGPSRAGHFAAALAAPSRTVPSLAAAALAAASLLTAACGPATPDAARPIPSASPTAVASAPSAPASRIRFELPRDGAPPDLERTPWPTDLARKPDGHLDLRAYPGRDSALVGEYLHLADEDLDGFSIAPVIYFHFEGPIALASLPTEDTSRSPSAPVALVDVDPSSPERGTFYPLAFRATTRDMRYVKAGTFAVRPLDGFVLRPGTLYAAVVRRSLGTLARPAPAAAPSLAATSAPAPAGAPAPAAAPSLAATSAPAGAPGLAATSAPAGAPTLAAAPALDRAPDLDAVLSKAPRTDATEERARALHAPAVDTLETLGIPRADIAAIALFRTARPHTATDGILRTLDDLFATPTSAPRVVTAEWDAARSMPGEYRVIRGTYCTPSFQVRLENAPFVEHEGGRISPDKDGRPQVVPVPSTAPFASPECPGQLLARFVLSVPEAPPPPAGYPLLVTAHGTGGSAFTFLGTGDYAGWAATEGFAAISTDQPLHGGKEGRPGGKGPLVLPLGIPVPPDRAGPELAFYNPLFPGAARGNLHQAQADAAVLVRLFGGLDFAALRTSKKAPLLALAKGQQAPRFDPRRTVLAGHSQGCQSIAVLGAVDPRARGVLLSGCGGDVRLGILHRRVMQLSPWIAMTLGLDPEELSSFHPLLALVQNLADPIDPLAFARYYWDPLPGRHPQRILHIEGLRDGYNPESASEALAIALRAQPRTPLQKPIRGLTLLATPQTSDRQIAQFSPPPGKDGHFVLYDIPSANTAFREVLRATPSQP